MVEALSEEKRCLTHELQRRLKEMKQDKNKFYEQVPTKSSARSRAESGSPECDITSESLTTQETSFSTPADKQYSDMPGERQTDDKAQAMHLEQTQSRKGSELSEEKADDPRVSVLQRDKELYDYQSKSIMHQITALTVKLNETKQKSHECNVVPYY